MLHTDICVANADAPPSRQSRMLYTGSCAENRDLAIDALAPLGEGAVVGEAAIYLFAKLPDGLDDNVVVERLIKEHQVTIIPGSACGAPGYIRVAYANCTLEDCKEACRRLKHGLEALIREAS